MKTSSKSKRVALYGALGLVILCMFCFAFTLIFSQTPEGQRLAAERKKTEVAGASTQKAMPTNTIKPTSTANPTKTLRPTNTSAPTKTITATHLPTDTRVPAGLPGLLPADVKVNAQDHYGMTCGTPQMENGVTAWTCKRLESTVLLRVDIYSYGGLQVDKVIVMIAGIFDTDTASQYLGFFATLPYDGAEPAKAKAWVINNISKDTDTIIGGVKFSLFNMPGDTPTRVLQVEKP